MQDRRRPMLAAFSLGLTAFTAIALIASKPAQAATLTLTAAGITDGFTITTFATMNPGNTGCCGGPFGVAVGSTGNIIVSDGATNLRYAFADVDGQTPGSALHSSASGSGVVAYATAGGQAYGTDGSGHFVEFN